MGPIAPMNIFLKQEIDRIQVVIKLVRVTLKDLLLAIEGVIIMNEVGIYFDKIISASYFIQKFEPSENVENYEILEKKYRVY